MNQLTQYKAWDPGVRWFHWINFISILCLLVLGLAILNSRAFGVDADGKILLKTLHVWVGYVFALNLAWRLVWAFVGGPRARWKAILPFGKGYGADLGGYLGGMKSGKPPAYIGHNPLGRLAVTALLLLCLSMAVTGLLLAGTDLFMPPLGGWFAEWIAAPGVDPASIVPGAKELYDEAAYQEMRAMRKPYITVHYYGFYVLMVVAAVHIAAVVLGEIREGGGLVSAMFSGRKALESSPADANESDG